MTTMQTSRRGGTDITIPEHIHCTSVTPQLQVQNQRLHSKGATIDHETLQPTTNPPLSWILESIMASHQKISMADFN